MSTWSKPQSKIVKVNVKGVLVRSEMKASIGCVMRDSNEWVKGCKAMIGLADLVTAEMWFIYYGLKMACENEEQEVMVECESEEAVNQVLFPDEEDDMYDLVCMIRQIMEGSWEFCDLDHIHESANFPTAALANHAIHGKGGLEILVDAPAFIQSLLDADKMT